MKTDSAVIKWLWSRIRGRGAALVLMAASNVAFAIFGVAFALGTKGVINSATGGTSEELIRAACIQFLIILGILVSQTTHRYLHSKLYAQLDRDWKRELSHRILGGNYATISEFHSGELLNRLNNDVRAMNEGVLDVVPALLSMIAKLGAVVLVLYSLEPFFTGILLALGLVVGVTTGVARKYLRNLNKQVSAAEGRVSGFFQETFEKLMLVQAMHVEKEVERRGDRNMEARYGLQKKR